MSATDEDVELEVVESGSWNPDRRFARRYVGGGHLDPEECDRYEESLREQLGDMTAAERDQWSRGARRRS